MTSLPLELALSLLVVLDSATAVPFRRDDPYLPCTGDLSKLNVNGQSPWIAYQSLQQPCVPSVTALPPATCRCTLLAYNLKMASEMCQSNTRVVPQSWSDWAQKNYCPPSQIASPPTNISYGTAATIPRYAYLSINNNSFDVAAALQPNPGWTPIQIATPIIVGLGVAITAGILFFIYRRSKRSVQQEVKRKPWDEPNLRGPRRFLGLFPDRSTVRSLTHPGPQWEIDGNAVPLDDVDEEGRPHTRVSSHSRGESTSSLLSSLRTNSSSPRSPPRSVFASIADRISLGKHYKKGASKGPDYKRVHVHPSHADTGFRIDDSLPTPPIRTEQHAVPPPPERDSSLPSVLDIRRPSTGMAGPSSMRHDSNDTRTDYIPPTIARSDFSLGTSDLRTPTSLTHSMPHHYTGPHPGSPLLPPTRILAMPSMQSPLTQSPPIRRQSLDSPTDSYAHELYPRNPPLY